MADAAATVAPTGFVLGPADQNDTLAAALRRRLPGRSWSEVRRLCESGKVLVDGERTLDAATRLRDGQRVDVRMAAPRPRPAIPDFAVIFEDPHLLVIEKPAGISSVPYDRKETGTAMDLIREAWRRAGRKATSTPLYIVHRLDKDTSGLLCFARTRLAERRLHTVFQRHEAQREYLAVAHGRVESQRIESVLIADRGDGLRGSARTPGRRPWDGSRPPLPRRAPPVPGASAVHAPPARGQRAITHLTAVRPLRGAMLCRARLETGRTHQIRIHLAEAGHPIVGETVYIRDFLAAGGRPISSPRLMLHAATLGFDHPVTGQRLDFSAQPPGDFQSVLDHLESPRG
ncbi:MAG TPA: pseudouridine synthase [Polyangia bacterium]|nr:pseudouridine synthase [Polyangia bacterium]